MMRLHFAGGVTERYFEADQPQNPGGRTCGRRGVRDARDGPPISEIPGVGRSAPITRAWGLEFLYGCADPAIGICCEVEFTWQRDSQILGECLADAGVGVGVAGEGRGHGFR